MTCDISYGIYSFMEKIIDNTLEQVRKSNALIDGQYKHGLQEQRILLTILSKIGFTDDLNQKYRVKWSEIMTATKGFTDTCKKIETVCESLRIKSIRLDKGNSIHGFGFVAEYEILRNEQCVDFILSPGMREQLLDLLSRGHFTLYNLQCVLSLPSTHSVRMYEILRSRAFMKQPVEIDLEKLKWSLDIPINGAGYKNFSDFRRFILEKSKKDLAKNTDINFSYKTLKTGRKITSLSVTISKNKRWQPTLIGFQSHGQQQNPPKRDFIRPGDIVSIEGERCEVGPSVLEHKGRSIPIGTLTVMLKNGKIELIDTNQGDK